MAEIGVNCNVKPLTSSADFFPDATGAPINFFPLARTGIQKVARTWCRAASATSATGTTPS